MEKRDGNGGHALACEMPGRPAHCCLVQRLQDFTIESRAFRHLETVPGAYRALRFHPGVGVGQAGGAVPRDLQYIPEPLGHQQSNRGAPVFQHGIGGNGRAVKDMAHIAGVDAVGRQDFRQPRHEPHRWVAGRGWGLVDPLGVGRRVTQNDVGERATDINGY